MNGKKRKNEKLVLDSGKFKYSSEMTAK